MSKNSEFIEEFKKTITATVKSIGRNEKLEIIMHIEAVQLEDF